MDLLFRAQARWNLAGKSVWGFGAEDAEGPSMESTFLVKCSQGSKSVFYFFLGGGRDQSFLAQQS